MTGLRPPRLPWQLISCRPTPSFLSSAASAVRSLLFPHWASPAVFPYSEAALDSTSTLNVTQASLAAGLT